MKAVVYGAGNIGRGFLGQLLYESGFHTVFVDVNRAVVEKINQDGRYPIRIVSNEKAEERTIRNISAVDGNDGDLVSKSIAQCDVLFTAVGVNVLPFIAQNIANGIVGRHGGGLDIIICENLLHADQYLRELTDKYAPVPENVGFVEASVGRMVPVMTEEMYEGNILRVWVEPFCTLPVDRLGFRNELPAIKNMLPSAPFAYHIQSKLYLHNMGHAVAAYLGLEKKYTFIWQAMGDEEIYDTVEHAMRYCAEGLAREHGVRLGEVADYARDLLVRFQNRHLGDTCERVGRDVKRKLAVDDRLLGAVALCNRHQLPTEPIKRGVMAALEFLR